MRKVQKNMVKRKKHKHTFRKIMIFLFIFILLGAGLYFGCIIQKVNVIGSRHYSEEEIKKKVITGKLEKNSLYLFLKYKYMEKPEIPFIETIDIELVNPVTININIYEKVITGCIEHMGQLLYFDKDGIIVESSTRKIDYIPMIEGLKYDKLVLNEKLKIEKEEMFEVILNITQSIKKNQLKIEKVIFLSNGEVTLKSGKIRVLLGKKEVYDMQIADLKNIFPKMKGLSGELDLRNIKDGKNKYVFRQDE